MNKKRRSHGITTCIYYDSLHKILAAFHKKELINNFSEVLGYKIKSVAFLYINDKQAKNKIRETTPFPIATHRK